MQNPQPTILDTLLMAAAVLGICTYSLLMLVSVLLIYAFFDYDNTQYIYFQF
jgi:hypothetical protein